MIYINCDDYSQKNINSNRRLKIIHSILQKMGNIPYVSVGLQLKNMTTLFPESY